MKALKTVINNVPKVLVEPSNYEARAEWTGTLAHNGLLMQEIGDWASHRIEHELVLFMILRMGCLASFSSMVQVCI